MSHLGTALRRARREAAVGARQQSADPGVPCGTHHIQQTLGHADLKQTSTYLNATVQGIEESMRKMDEQRGLLQSVANAPTIAPLPVCNNQGEVTVN